MIIRKVRHDWPDKAGHFINYDGHNYYSFFHFPQSVELQSDGQIIQTRSNACIMFAPKSRRYYFSKQKMVRNFLFIQLDAEEMIKNYNIPLDKVFYPSNTTFISEIFQKIEFERNSDNPNKERLVELYLEEFLLKLSRALHENTHEQVSALEQLKMRNLRHSILSQPEKKWTIAQMAELASLSPSRFHAVYKSVFGISPISELNIARVDYAKTLLRSQEHYTVQQITEKLGYQSQCYFINKFKEITGTTPGAYRKRYR